MYHFGKNTRSGDSEVTDTGAGYSGPGERVNSGEGETGTVIAGRTHGSKKARTVETKNGEHLAHITMAHSHAHAVRLVMIYVTFENSVVKINVRDRKLREHLLRKE